MSPALRAEWVKLRTVASTGWLLLGIVMVTVAAGAAADAAGLCYLLGRLSAGCHPAHSLNDLPIGPWAGLGVHAAWAAAALLAGGLLLRRRDA